MRKRLFTSVVVILFISAIIFHRILKIMQKEERRQREAESVVATSIWDIVLPSNEFIGDLSQVGEYLVYELAGLSYAMRLDNGVIRPINTQESHLIEDPSIVGLSVRLKKEFRIEHDGDINLVAQYNLVTRARGIIAKLPTSCSQFKTVQRLPQNFFVLEALCTQSKSEELSKRIMVIELETRRLTYASGYLPKDARFVALQRGV